MSSSICLLAGEIRLAALKKAYQGSVRLSNFTAKDGRERLDTIQKAGPFYALVTDFNMPQINGGELVKEVMKREIPLERIVILSAIMENEVFFDELDQKNYKIIFQSKPFAPDKLLSMIRS